MNIKALAVFSPQILKVQKTLTKGSTPTTTMPTTMTMPIRWQTHSIDSQCGACGSKTKTWHRAWMSDATLHVYSTCSITTCKHKLTCCKDDVFLWFFLVYLHMHFCWDTFTPAAMFVRSFIDLYSSLWKTKYHCHSILSESTCVKAPHLPVCSIIIS